MNGTGGMSNNANPNITGLGSPQMFNMQMPPLSNAVQQQNRPGTNPQQMQQSNMASMPQAMMGAQMINGAPGMAMNNMPQAQQQQIMQSLRNMPQQMNLAMMQSNMAQNNQGPQMGMGMGMGMSQAMMGAQMINGAPGKAMNNVPQAQQQQLMQSLRNMPQQTTQRAQSSGSNIQNTVQPLMPQNQMMQQSQGMQESPNSHYEQNHSSGGHSISQNTMNTKMSGGDGIHGAPGNSQGQQQSLMPDMKSMQTKHAQMAMFLQMQQKQQHMQSQQQQAIVRAQPDQRPESQSSNFQSNLQENKNDLHKAPLIPSQEKRHINTNSVKDLARRRSQPSQQQMQMPSPMSQMQMSKELQLKLQRQMIDQIREPSVVPGSPNDYPGHMRQGKQKLKLPTNDIAEQSFDRTKGVRNNISPSSLSQNISGFQGFEQTNRSVIQNPTKIPTPSNATSGSVGRLSSASTIRDVDPHHKLMKPKDACPLIDSMPWEEKVIYISRHVMGGRKGNGYLRTLSHLKRIRKKLSDEDEPEAKMAKTFARSSDDHKNQETRIDTNHEIEKLKQHPTIAKSILGEIGLGITFCNTVASAIESVLSSIGPDDIENGSGGNVIKQARRKSTGSKRAPNSKGQAAKIKLPQTENQVIQQSRNIHGTMSRKERDKQLSIPKMKDPLEAMVVADEKKPTKRELAFRHFETTRYRALKNGDFVAAKFQESGAWMLARVVHDQYEQDMSSADLKSLSKEKRGEFLGSRVVLQDIESFNAGVKDLNKMKMVVRKSILPLPRNHMESNLWLYRCRKGFRVYAMYPSTTCLYPATVIDSTSFCINEDNICVVEFDGDAGKTILSTRFKPPQCTCNHLTKLKYFLFLDEMTGKLHHKHIPGRFLTLIPKEYPVIKASRRKSGSNANSGRGKDGEDKSQVRQNKSGTTKERLKLAKQASSSDTLLMEGLGNLEGIDDIDLEDDLKSVDRSSL